MFDVDHFKAINDQLGHLRGDELLRRIGMQLTKVLRTSDLRCRYGGDEFLIILPETPALGAERVADGVRRELAAITIGGAHDARSITVSIGVATAGPEDRTPDLLIERADKALYRAKRNGRNRFAVAPLSVALAQSVALDG
jgi:two-component system cell cycle response regulator